MFSIIKLSQLFWRSGFHYLLSRRNLTILGFFVGVIFAFILFMPRVSAANYNENFDDLSTGNIHGQGSFTVNQPNVNDVQNSVRYSSPNALLIGDGPSSSQNPTVIYAPGNLLGITTTVSFRVRHDHSSLTFNHTVSFRNSSGNIYGYIAFRENSTYPFEIWQHCDAVDDVYLATYTPGQWYKIDVQFNGGNYRMRINGGSWTAYCDGEGSVTASTIDRIYFGGLGFPDFAMYIDDLSTNIYSDSILSPSDGDYLPTGIHTFSGECETPGQNYNLSWSELYGRPNPPNITCQADHTWSYDYEITESGGGGKPYYFCNELTDECVNIGVIGYVSGSNNWFVNVSYPTLDDTKYAKVQPDTDFPFRFSYTSPPNAPLVYLAFIKYTDCTYTTPDYSIFANYTTLLDPDNLGYVDSDDTVTDGITNCYSIAIGDGTTVSFNVNFRVEGSTDDDAQIPSYPNETDLGAIGNFVRSLVLPRYGFVQAKFLSVQNSLDDKLQDFYAIRNHFLDEIENMSGENFVSPTVSVFGSDPVALIPTNSTISDGFDFVRSFSAVVLYSSFAIFLFVTIHHYLKA